MLPERTTILIVGAGPTGLAAALSLLKQGFTDILVVDAAARTELTSRAAVIHAATLEALETIDCAELLIDRGIKSRGVHLGDRAGPLLAPDLSSLAPYTKYPFSLVIPQHITEEILEQRLEANGTGVRRPFKVTSTSVAEDSMGWSTVSFESGEVVRAQYIIGADGAKSTVRQLAGIGFSDPDGDQIEEVTAQIVLADVIFNKPCEALPTEMPLGAISPGKFFLVIPLTKKSSDETQDIIYRVGFNVPLSLGSPPKDPSISYIQEHLDSQGPYNLSSQSSINPSPIHISKKIWATRFRTHSAIAATFLAHTRDGDRNGASVLLLGDAAHIHSPAGGQGMNLGLRDAIGLGPALALHVRDPDGSSGLVDYVATRYERALATIHLTKQILGLISALSSNRLFGLQKWVLWLVGKLPIVQRTMAWRLSGLGNR